MGAPGTTFTFVNDGPKKALELTKAAAGPDKDVQIAGGGDTVLQFLNAGLVDEFTLSVAPVFLGGGVRLFDRIDRTGSAAGDRRCARLRAGHSHQLSLHARN